MQIPRITLAFVLTGALTGLVGMFWGMHMAATQDHTLFPAHAHLNLLGWVTLSLMGLFYALPGVKVGRLAWVNYALSTLGVLVMTPMLAFLLSNEPVNGPKVGPLMPIPESMVVLGMIAFIASVVRTGLPRRS